MIVYKDNIEQLRNLIASHTKVFLLFDENSERYCIQYLNNIGLLKSNFINIVIPAGEQHKDINTVQFIWSKLVENHADRKSLLINIGGGVVTDIGGFAASCYQRGIDFINVPTTLLGMIDAAVGGKNGIDFQGLKNQIGVFSQPVAVVVLFEFLQTLPERELLSGLAEIIKYGFIADKSFLDAKLPLKRDLIIKSIQVKDEITRGDSMERGRRKILNFGHTIGHAIETYLIENHKDIKHGEAVALGMLSALYLSEKYCNLDHEITLFYKKLYARIFNRFDLSDILIDALLEIMRHDKKNEGGDIRFVLISDLEKPVCDIVVKTENIIDSIRYLVDYQNDESYWNK